MKIKLKTNRRTEWSKIRTLMSIQMRSDLSKSWFLFLFVSKDNEY